jgi:hypothetical protein
MRSIYTNELHIHLRGTRTSTPTRYTYIFNYGVILHLRGTSTTTKYIYSRDGQLQLLGASLKYNLRQYENTTQAPTSYSRMRIRNWSGIKVTSRIWLRILLKIILICHIAIYLQEEYHRGCKLSGTISASSRENTTSYGSSSKSFSMGRPTPSCIVHRIQDAGQPLELLKADNGKPLGRGK